MSRLEEISGIRLSDTRKSLYIDIETYCDLDLRKVGVYKYAEHPSFEILLLAYSYDPKECNHIIDLAMGEEMPEELLNDIYNHDVAKFAYNASFEMACISSYFGRPIDNTEWYCSMGLSVMQGLPAGLAVVGRELGIEQEKMIEGKMLIDFFCKKHVPNARNNYQERNYPKDYPDKWAVFKKYCMRDVTAELEVDACLKDVPITSLERCTFLIDNMINTTGIRIDTELVDKAIEINDKKMNEDLTRLQELTGLDNPKSNTQLKKWLISKGIEVDSIDKAAKKELLAKTTDPTIKEVIELQLSISKTSNAKYYAMKASACEDDRVRGLFQYYGARTGRWAGRLVQLQNLPQNHLEPLDLYREVVKNWDHKEDLDLIYDEDELHRVISDVETNVSSTLSQLIRTCFIPKEGCKFIVADYAAIEARVIAFLSGEEWRLDVFRTHGKIYEASASMMFHVPIEQVTKGSELRKKGKVAELALGYQGSVGALKAMGADKMGLSDEELKDIVIAWRKASPHIAQFWYDVENAAIQTIRTRKRIKVGSLMFGMSKRDMVIKLPSDRYLFYRNARVKDGKIEFEGLDSTSKKYGPITTYGGKLTENIVQATARDCLALAMARLVLKGFTIVGHIHDEVIVEAPMDASVEEVCDIMGEPISWAEGLYLRAAGFESMYYMKD